MMEFVFKIFSLRFSSKQLIQPSNVNKQNQVFELFSRGQNTPPPPLLCFCLNTFKNLNRSKVCKQRFYVNKNNYYNVT